MERVVKFVFCLCLFFFVVDSRSFTQEGNPKGEEAIGERRYGVIWLEDKMENIENIFFEYIELYNRQERIYIYNKIYSAKVTKERVEKIKRLNIFRFRYEYIYSYFYKINNGWMLYNMTIEGKENIFSKILGKSNNYNILITLRLHYFPWKSFFKYKEGEQISEEEEKWKTYRRFIEEMVNYLKIKRINIKNFRYLTGYEEWKGDQLVMNYLLPLDYLTLNIPIIPEYVEYWKKMGVILKREELKKWQTEGYKVGDRVFKVYITLEDMKLLEEIIVD